MFPRIQRGFAIVSAIFLLVVLAALGGFIATVSTTQHIGSAQDIQGSQAYYAARAGVEWGLYQALKASSCEPSSASGSSFVYSTGNISVTVDCFTTPQPAPKLPDEAGAGYLYTITATACTPGNAAAPFCPGNAANPNYVERRVTALAESPVP